MLLMKSVNLFLLLLFLAACGQSPKDARQLEEKMDSTQHKIDKAYKPGIGEFMSSIQIHHAKLWFAGINRNWKLADFEMHEIQEALDDIQEFAADRPEVKEIGMIRPPLDSLGKAIGAHDEESFKKNYIVLTNTCNSCHKATGHEFNVIITPSVPPVSNQSFKSADSAQGK